MRVALVGSPNSMADGAMSINVEWMTQAACLAYPPETFYPTSTGVPGQREVEAAIRICRGCPVIVQCREHGKRFSRGEGVWGGVYRAARRPRGAQKAEIGHGTEAGHQQHRRRGEKACMACRQAATLASALRAEKRRK